jgi:hypothetical protein
MDIYIYILLTISARLATVIKAPSYQSSYWFGVQIEVRDLAK